MEGIAIIGMHGRFPRSRDLDAFWQNLRDGVDCITFFSEEELLAAGVDPETIRDPNYIPAGGVLDDADRFDAPFFGISPREAEGMDPQHRVFLEGAWATLEDAGYDPDRYDGAIGVYAGVSLNTYLQNYLFARRPFQPHMNDLSVIIGNGNEYVATRASYKMNLTGPSIAVQAACATSLVAIAQACQALLQYQCDMALAGGVSVRVPQVRGYHYVPDDIFSPDGHCHAFDADAKGTVFGNGVGIILLKRLDEALADGDTIHAVIRGVALNNDGGLKVGYTAPSVEGQARVITMAQELAEVAPETIGYVECHGTGTALGDPIEITALTQAFHTDRKGFCAVGSIKANMGHLDAAAGVAGLLRAVMALKHRQIPPSIHFRRPNPAIDFDNSPFYVNTELRDWETNGTPRRAGVSSFGIGGTNVHVVLEEGPEVTASPSLRSHQLLLLSARTPTALDRATERLGAHLTAHPELDLADVAHTLHVGRKAFRYRRFLVASDTAEARERLVSGDGLVTGEHRKDPPPVVFIFPGQGAQYPNMGRGLYDAEPVFRQHVDTCCEKLEPLIGLDLRTVLYPPEGQEEAAAERLKQTALTQPALFTVEYAMARLWQSWGVTPSVMIGHSIGESVAACMAGVFSLDDALSFVATRARLMQARPGGSMLAVLAAEADVLPYVAEPVSVAVVNGPQQCVLSGPHEAIDAVEARLAEEGFACTRLKTSHAFHSAMMEPMLDELTAHVAGLSLNHPQIPFVSNRTGTWITDEQATDPAYWARHVRHTVRFADGLETLMEDPDRVMLECGPWRTLSALSGWKDAAAHVVLASMRHPMDDQPDMAFLLNTVGELWLAGVEVDGRAFYAHEPRRRVPLPTYPFEGKRYWYQPAEAPAEKPAAASPALQPAPDPLAKKPDVKDWFYVPAWERVPRPAAPLDRPETWLVFTDAHGLGDVMLMRLFAQGQKVIRVEAGEAFERKGDLVFSIRREHAEDYDRLMQTLRKDRMLPDRIVHLWHVGEAPVTPQTCFNDLLFLAVSLGGVDTGAPRHLGVVTSGLYDVVGTETLQPEKAVMVGPMRTFPREFSGFSCRGIDLVLPDSGRFGVADADRLIAEMMAPGVEEMVAFRGRHRWVQTFAPVPLEGRLGRPERLRDQGVYLITGGLGGIGLVLAEYLAETTLARLVLVGRNGLPPRDEWDPYLAGHPETDRTARRIRAVRNLEDRGAEVLVLQADVTDRGQMKAVLEATRERFGTLNGVIHAAGIRGERMMIANTPDNAARVLDIKVQGARILAELCPTRDLDFMVFCSSFVAALGELGQADYAGANAFMDAFAHARHAAGEPYTVSINWEAWGEVGMGVDTELPDQLKARREEMLRKALRNREGVEVFRRVLQTDLPQVIVSTYDWPARMAEHRAATLEATLREADAATPAAPTPAPAPASAPSASAPAAPVDPDAPQNDIEAAVAETWAQLLGVERVKRTDDFFELGGNSLLATQLNNRLRQRFEDAELSLRALFDHSTVAGLAEVIAEVYPPQPLAAPTSATAPVASMPSASAPAAPAVPVDPDAPQNDIEAAVAETWAQLLGVERVKRTDDFFELGGNSLLATQLNNRLRQRFEDAELSLRALFDHPTVAGLAEVIATSYSGDGSEAVMETPPAPPVAPPEPPEAPPRESEAATTRRRPIRQVLEETPPGEREAVLADYLRDQVAEILRMAPADLPEDGDLSGYDLDEITRHLTWTLKQYLKLTVYEPEIKQRPHIGTLARFVLTERERLDTILQADEWDDTLEIPSLERSILPPPRKVADALDEKNPRMVFVLSAPRTGSTLFRLMLSGHPALFCPPELTLLSHPDMRSWSRDPDILMPREGLVMALMMLMGLEREESEAYVERLVAEEWPTAEVFRLLQDHLDGRILVEKTPSNALRMETLESAEAIFDRPLYLHLTRHPYASIDSFVRARFDRVRGDEGNPFAIADAYWGTMNRNILAFSRTLPEDRYHRVSYEELVREPERIMRGVCAFLGLPYEEAMVRPYEKSTMFGGPGDPNIFQHTGVNPALADVWRKIRLPRPLSDTTREVALELGYELPYDTVNA